VVHFSLLSKVEQNEYSRENAALSDSIRRLYDALLLADCGQVWLRPSPAERREEDEREAARLSAAAGRTAKERATLEAAIAGSRAALSALQQDNNGEVKQLLLIRLIDQLLCFAGFVLGRYR